MPTKTRAKAHKKTVKILSTSLPPATASPGATPTASPTTPTISVSATSAGSALSIAPPDVTLPAIPAGFTPVDLRNYRGTHPKAAQVTALPDAITELESSTTYASTFGPAAPPVATLTIDLAIASRWTTLRTAVQAFLIYVKSNEAITWKTGLAELDQLNAAYKVVVAQNPAIATAYPATTRLLDVPKVLAARATATRARKVKAKATTSASTASTASAANPPAPVASTTATSPSAAAAPVTSTTVTTVTGGAAH